MRERLGRFWYWSININIIGQQKVPFNYSVPRVFSDPISCLVLSETFEWLQGDQSPDRSPWQPPAWPWQCPSRWRAAESILHPSLQPADLQSRACRLGHLHLRFCAQGLLLWLRPGHPGGPNTQLHTQVTRQTHSQWLWLFFVTLIFKHLALMMMNVMTNWRVLLCHMITPTGERLNRSLWTTSDHDMNHRFKWLQFKCGASRLPSESISQKNEERKRLVSTKPLYQVFTSFRPWSVCDRCGLPGEQVRVGLCYVHSHYLHVRFRRANQTVTSCGSGAVLRAFGRLRQSSVGAKLEVKSCEATCGDRASQSTKITALMAFLGLK